MFEQKWAADTEVNALHLDKRHARIVTAGPAQAVVADGGKQQVMASIPTAKMIYHGQRRPLVQSGNAMFFGTARTPARFSGTAVSAIKAGSSAIQTPSCRPSGRV